MLVEHRNESTIIDGGKGGAVTPKSGQARSSSFVA
jgi:hypothetical protein